MQARYSITTPLTEGHVEAGSAALDELAPFKDDVDFGNLPDALLDWIALHAYMLADKWPGPVVRDSMTPFSTVYAAPEPNRHARTARELVGPYLKRSGVRV